MWGVIETRRCSLGIDDGKVPADAAREGTDKHWGFISDRSARRPTAGCWFCRSKSRSNSKNLAFSREQSAHGSVDCRSCRLIPISFQLILPRRTFGTEFWRIDVRWILLFLFFSSALNENWSVVEKVIDSWLEIHVETMWI